MFYTPYSDCCDSYNDIKPNKQNLYLNLYISFLIFH